jgi:hypothetical protein
MICYTFGWRQNEEAEEGWLPVAELKPLRQMAQDCLQDYLESMRNPHVLLEHRIQINKLLQHSAFLSLFLLIQKPLPLSYSC